MGTKRVWRMVGSGLILALLLAGCAKSTPTSTPGPTTAPPKTSATTTPPTAAPTIARPQGELRIAVQTLGKENLDPAQSSPDDILTHQAPMYDLLLRAEGATIQPGVAEKWELAPDGKAWVFYIRKGIKFHNGEELTADDAKFTIERYMLPIVANADTRNSVERVEKVDEYTIKVYTKGPQPFYPTVIAPYSRTHGALMPKDYIEQHDAAYFSRYPVGSGPYKYSRFISGDMIEYEAIDEHWRVGVPAFKKLTFIKIPEESTRVALLKVSQADAGEVAAESATELEASGFKTAATIAEQALIVLPGNYLPQAAQMPTADSRVRQALTLAINRDEIIKSFFGGRAFRPAPFPVHAISVDIDISYWMDYADNIYRYDPEEAKRLLKEAGYPNGFTMKLWSQTRPGAPYLPKLAEVVQGYWGMIGVKAEIIPIEYVVYTTNRNTMKNPEWIGAGFTFTSSHNPSIGERLYGNYHSKGHTAPLGTAFPELDKLIEGSLVELDPTKRKEMADKAIKIVTDTYTAVMLARVPSWFAIGPRVTFDFPKPPTNANYGYYLDTAKHAK